MQINFVVFALSRQSYKEKVCESNQFRMLPRLVQFKNERPTPQ